MASGVKSLAQGDTMTANTGLFYWLESYIAPYEFDPITTEPPQHLLDIVDKGRDFM